LDFFGGGALTVVDEVGSMSMLGAIVRYHVLATNRTASASFDLRIPGTSEMVDLAFGGMQTLLRSSPTLGLVERVLRKI
jgi:hypothetical protein